MTRLRAILAAAGLTSALLMSACQGQSVGTSEGGQLRVVGGDPARFGYGYWDLDPGDSIVVSAGALRLCLADAGAAVTITDVRYLEQDNLVVSGWATAPLREDEEELLPADPSTLEEMLGDQGGPHAVLTQCDPGRDHPVESQTSFGWEATWVGPDPGVGEQLLIEYENAQGEGGALTVDTALVLCATEQECGDADPG